MMGFLPYESWALDTEEWCLEWGSQLRVCNSISQRLEIPALAQERRGSILGEPCCSFRMGLFHKAMFDGL